MCYTLQAEDWPNYLALSRLKTFILHCFQRYSTNSLITVLMTTYI